MLEHRLRLPVLLERRHHREHHLQWVLGRGPQHGPQLGLQEFRLFEGEPDAPDAEERVRLGRLRQVRERLVRADVERAEDQRSPFQSLGDAPVRRVLLVLAWHRVPLQEQELGAEEADALGAVLDRGLDVDGRADVCDDLDPAPVVGHRRLGGGSTGASGCLLALGRASLVPGG